MKIEIVDIIIFFCITSIIVYLFIRQNYFTKIKNSYKNSKIIKLLYGYIEKLIKTMRNRKSYLKRMGAHVEIISNCSQEIRCEISEVRKQIIDLNCELNKLNERIISFESKYNEKMTYKGKEIIKTIFDDFQELKETYEKDLNL